jgi:hypothetical protein
MHEQNQRPPLQAAARLVALYQHHVPVALWPDAEPDEATMVPLIRTHHGRLRAAVDLAREARAWMAAPVAPAAAAAFLLLANGIDHADIRRFLAPTDETLEPEDPRESLRRIMQLHDAAADEHPDHESLAYILRAWNLWSSGAETRRVTWKPDDGMPSVNRWAVDIPTPT